MPVCDLWTVLQFLPPDDPCLGDHKAFSPDCCRYYTGPGKLSSDSCAGSEVSLVTESLGPV